MIFQDLLRRAVAGRHRVLQQFVDTLAPHVLIAFSHKPALGGSGHPPVDHTIALPPEAIVYTEEVYRRFSETNPDQSLSAHIINGIFAGARIAELLPEDKQFNDTEWQVWLLGFIVHDYTKVYGIALDAEHIPVACTLVERLGTDLHFDDFCANWKQYLQDIVFIAQNTQKVQGANLNIHAYPDAQLHFLRLDTLRLVASFADVLVHITRPSDVAQRDDRGRNTAQNLRTTLGILFGIGKTPRLFYHQLTDVRGLISNLINNAIMHEFERQGYIPYLFFPDGVVYLDVKREDILLDRESLIQSLWHHVGNTLAGMSSEKQEDSSDADTVTEDQNEADEPDGGLRITRTKDYMKVPPVLNELLAPESLIAAGRSAALRIRTSLCSERIGSEVCTEQDIDTSGLSQKDKKELFARVGLEAMQKQGLPADVRVDQLAEYLGFIWRRLLRTWFPKSDWATTLLLEILELQDDISPERAEAQRSGTPTGWFYVAARYMQIHSLSQDGLIERMDEIGMRVLAFLKEQQMSPPDIGRFKEAFCDYVGSIVNVNGTILTPAESIHEHFIQEFQSYCERKENNKVQCSLCSSPYEAHQQDKSEVLFKPQQYSNKTRLDTSTVVRGICPICALEMMLRQVQQGMLAGKAQDEKPITLFLYPTYFFTPETAQVVHDFINRLRDLNVPDLLFSHLGKQGWNFQTFASYDTFVVTDTDIADSSLTQWTLRTPRFSERDPASLFFFSMRPAMKNPTDTDAWIVPVLYTLALPLLLDVKVVATSSFVPIYGSGADFRETSILDAPHHFVRYIPGIDTFRIDELLPALWKLLRLYELHLDVFAESKDMKWGWITTLAKDIVTDPYFVFQYYDRKQRASKDKPQKKEKKSRAKAKTETSSGDGVSRFVVQRYYSIYETLGGKKDMGFIGRLVDAYATFYRARNLKAAHDILRPLVTSIEVVVESDPKTERDDLHLLVAGAVNDDQERVRNDPKNTGGFDPITTNKEIVDYKERLVLSREKIAAFVDLFLTEAFEGYCNKDRGILRERANRIRSAARFYYLAHYTYRGKLEADDDIDDTEENDQ